MKIIFAKHIGFCFGVKRAVALAANSLKKDKKPVWFLGSLVHNEKVLERFKRKNVKFILNPKQAQSGTLIVQAHGFSPFENKKISIRDATCPLVKRVQILAGSLYKKGYQVIIIGDKRHSETKGIKGYAGKEAIVIENEKQAGKLSKFKKIGVVAQTTQGLENFKRILKILKRKSRQVKCFNTICSEVSIRQKELNEISKKSQGILIIGSRSSANTGRLFQVAKKLKKKVLWVNSSEELKKKNLEGISVLGVVSGTSAPDWEIKKIKKWLVNLKQ